jgi:F-type H+-transporting ATPase subunit b
MPQLNPDSFVTQLFWLLLTFSTLYFLLKTRGLPKITAVLAMREKRVDNDLQQAKELQKEAVALRDVLEHTQVQAQQQMRHILQDMKTDITRTVVIRQNLLNQEIAAETAATELRIKAAQNEAFASIQETVSVVATECFAKLSGTHAQQQSLQDSVRVVTSDYKKLAS